MLVFIAATVGLLGYAGVRPWVDQWREVSIDMAITRLALMSNSAGKATYPCQDEGINRQVLLGDDRYAIIDTNVRDTQRPSTCAVQLRDAYKIVRQRCTA